MPGERKTWLTDADVVNLMMVRKRLSENQEAEALTLQVLLRGRIA